MVPLTAILTMKSILQQILPDDTTFDDNGTTFGNTGTTFDIGKDTRRTLPIPMRDLTHLQGDAVSRFEQVII